jgi:ketosteroid isomerase-like protein
VSEAGVPARAVFACRGGKRETPADPERTRRISLFKGCTGRARYNVSAMIGEADPLAPDREFFTSLLNANAEALDRLLVDEFMLVDVMRGAEIEKPALLSVLGSGQLRFEKVEPAEVRVRLYSETAIVTGRTQMSGQFGEEPFQVRSRYTHVYVRQDGSWRLVTAQGSDCARLSFKGTDCRWL